jgi:L,D-transpeptidase YcbB
LFQTIESVEADALNPEDYHQSKLGALLADAREGRADTTALEALLTDAFVTLYAHQHGGRVDPVTLRRRSISARERSEIEERIAAATERGELSALIADLQPAHRDYPVLKALLERYRDFAAQDPTNAAVRERALQLELNLEARRWMPETTAARSVIVNVAAFQLTAYDGETVALSSRVIVGKRMRRTPLFSSAIAQVIANPEWWVPARIASEELWPLEQKQPGYLVSRGFRVISNEGKTDRLVQAAGAHNALGRIKLVIPNHHSVYLHDTPARELFERDIRAFSHGCIRVERAVELGAWALGSGGEDALSAAIAAGKTVALKVADPPDVHLVYWTVRLAEDGTIEFHPDIYGRDAALARVLSPSRNARYEAPTRSAWFASCTGSGHGIANDPRRCRL